VKLNKRILAGGLVILMAAVAAVVALAGGGHNSAAASPQPTAEGQFAVLAQGPASTDPESLSEKAREWLSSISSDQSSNLAAEAAGATAGSLAQSGTSDVTALGTTEGSSGDTVVAAEVGGRVCVLSEGFEVGVCAGRGLVEAGQAFSAAPVGCDAYHVVGVMPDGVSTLTATTVGGQSAGQIPVEGNVYEATLTPEDTVLSAAGGDIEVELPLADYAAGNSACRQ
jgi:hypothetical protein